jgi:hypothetical protein
VAVVVSVNEWLRPSPMIFVVEVGQVEGGVNRPAALVKQSVYVAPLVVAKEMVEAFPVLAMVSTGAGGVVEVEARVNVIVPSELNVKYPT